MGRGSRPRGARRGARGRSTCPLPGCDRVPRSPNIPTITTTSSTHSVITTTTTTSATITTTTSHSHSALTFLQPITTFSPVRVPAGGAGAVGCPEARVSNRALYRNSVAIEVIVRLLCQRVPKAGQREWLFKSLCAVIQQYNSKLYLPLHAFPEYQELEANLLQQFEGLVQAAQTRLSSADAGLSRFPLSPVTQLALNRSSSSLSPYNRYLWEFEEEEELGRGGFGVVMKVRSRLDGCCYAVKIITMEDVREALCLREVQSLAKLNHPNIVRYNSTWLQPYHLPRHPSSWVTATLTQLDNDSGESSSSDSSPAETSPVEKGPVPPATHSSLDDFVVFQEQETESPVKPPPVTTLPQRRPKSRLPPLSSLSSSTSSSSSSSSKALLSYRSPWSQRQPQLCLFIQMGLCGESLGVWLARRNSGPGQTLVDEACCLDLFCQVVEAVRYIHQQDIIHRDIKPENIFFTLDGRHIQLGDFGLARSLPQTTVTTPTATCLTPITEHPPHTRNLGTPIYSAPELASSNYGSKSDMHNLGIILLELFMPFKTGSERVHVISSLKTKRHLDPDLIQLWPHVVPWILRLTHPDPAQRPTASEVLKSPLLHPWLPGSPPPLTTTTIHSQAESLVLGQACNSGGCSDSPTDLIKPEIIKIEALSNSYRQFNAVRINTSDLPEQRWASGTQEMLTHKDRELANLREENEKLQRRVAELEREMASLRTNQLGGK